LRYLNTRKCHRANAQPQSTDLSEYYHVNYFLPYLDYLISKFNSRFNENNDSVISNLKLIIPKYYFACETSDDKILNAAHKIRFVLFIYRRFVV